MSTSLQQIDSTNGVEESTLLVTVFCGHGNLVTNGEETRRCVQITVVRNGRDEYAHLTDSATRKLIEQLQAVVDGDYQKFED